MRGGRGKGFVVSSPIDRERYPNREREGLEGPYKSRKSGKIFYYDRKEGKYYDPDSDMYLDVSDVMEGTEMNEWWEDKVNPRSKGWKSATVKMNFKSFNAGGEGPNLYKKGTKLFYHPMDIKGHGGRKYNVVIAATDPKNADTYFSVHPDRLGLKGFDSATGPLKDHVELDEATRHTVYVDIKGKNARSIFRKMEKQIAGMFADSYKSAEYQNNRGNFAFDAKLHDGDERKKMAELIKRTAGVEFSHAIKEDTELTEAWTADTVKRNADIGSDSGYGINIKKRGSITKTPYKHMLMLRTSGKKIKVRFDFGKDEFVGTPNRSPITLTEFLVSKKTQSTMKSYQI